MADDVTTNGTKTKKTSGWLQTERPFWWPDSRGFLLASMVIICGVSLFYRMAYPSEVNDKILDMMITIAFSTCLVLVYNWSFGSSSDTGKTQDTQSRILEKVTNGPVVPVALPVAAATVVLAWWGLITKEEQAKLDAAAPADPRIAAFVANSKLGKATPEELAYAVGLGLLTAERAAVIQST